MAAPWAGVLRMSGEAIRIAICARAGMVRVMPVEMTPGWSVLAVCVPLPRRRASSRVKRMLASFDAP